MLLWLFGYSIILRYLSLGIFAAALLIFLATATGTGGIPADLAPGSGRHYL